MERKANLGINARSQIALHDALQVGYFVEHTDIENLNPQQIDVILRSIGIVAHKGLAAKEEDIFRKSAMLLIDLGSYVPRGKGGATFYQGQHSDIFLHTLRAVSREVPTLTRYLSEKRKDPRLTERKKHAMHLINLLAENSSDNSLQSIAFTVYRKHLQDIIREMLTGNYNFDSALANYIERYPKEWDRVIDELKNQLRLLPREELRPMLRFFASGKDSGIIRARGQQLAYIILENMGYQSDQIDQLLREWDLNLSGTIRLKYNAIYDNLDQVFELEHSIPGITKWLRANFGIQHLGRYPSRLLEAQYRERDDTDRPYGLIVYPYADDNTAFHNDMWLFINLKEQLDNLYNSKSIKYNLRILEAGNIGEMAKRLIRIRRKYGPAAFGIIGGHGDSDSIKFGKGWRPGDILTSDQLRTSKGIQRGIASFFQQDAPIILISCSTGKRNGIAQVLSKFGVSVTGPDQSTNAGKLEIDYREGLVISVRYAEGKARLYVGGKYKKL